MPFSEDIQLVANIIHHLPRRVKVKYADKSLPFVSGDILELILCKDMHMVQAQNRLTEKCVNIPLDYQGNIHTLGNLCNSVDEIENNGGKFYSVEGPFESPISPWEKRVIPTGSIVEVTDIEHGKGLMGKIQGDTIFIEDMMPLSVKPVLQDTNLSLKEIVQTFNLPHNIVIIEKDRPSAEYFLPGNYKLMDVITVKVILGYREPNEIEVKHFLIPSHCNLRISAEDLKPSSSNSGNAFFVPKQFYDDRTIHNLYSEYIHWLKNPNPSNKPIVDESVPVIPPRFAKPKSLVHRHSLKTQDAEKSKGPQRPERQRKGPTQTSNLSNQSGSKLSLEDIKQDVFDERGNEDLSDEEKFETVCRYMDLRSSNLPDNHVYDEMLFEEENKNTNSLRKICCGCFSRGPRRIRLMSVKQVMRFLSKNGLIEMAEVCGEHKLDGSFVSELTINDLMNEPFHQSEEQIETFIHLKLSN